MQGYTQLGPDWTRDTRNEENRMFKELYDQVGNVVQEITEEVINQIIDDSRLNWLPSFVDTYEDIATTYPNPSEGDTTMQRYDSADYPVDENDKRAAGTIWRFDGTAWEPVMGIDPSAITGLETALNEKIGDINNLTTADKTNIVSAINSNAIDLEQRGVNALLNGVVGDGVTDDTQAIQDLISNNSYVIFPIPPVEYSITDEIVIPSNRTLEFIGGNHWNPNNMQEVRFTYNGVEDANKAMFRVSKSVPGVEPTVDTSNVKFRGGCVLDGNAKVGYGFYAAYIINESSFDKITVINTLTDGASVDKAWYSSFGDITAKGNLGNGISIGKNGWGGVNGCPIGNLRGHSNGSRGDFTESNPDSSYGVGLWLGSGTKVSNVVSEQNYGAGLFWGMGKGSLNNVEGVYLEKNGIQAKNDGKTSRNWGLIVQGKPGVSGISLENIYLARSVGDPEVQSVWLTGSNPTSPVEIRNIGIGAHLKSEWDNYKLTGYVSSGISLNIEGHLPKKVEGTLNSSLTTLYVSSAGNDNNDGRTAATSFATLVKAIEKAKAINTVTNIICSGNLVHEVIDLSGLDREITIDGEGTALIDGSSNGNGLYISNASNVVNINNFDKISRLDITNCFKIRCNTVDYGHSDNAFNGTVEARNSNVSFDTCNFDGSLATNAVKNGFRLYNTEVHFVDVTVTGYSSGSFSLSEGSRVYADIYVPQFAYVNWIDGSGFVQGGDRMRNSVGTVTFS